MPGSARQAWAWAWGYLKVLDNVAKLPAHAVKLSCGVDSDGQQVPAQRVDPASGLELQATSTVINSIRCQLGR